MAVKRQSTNKSSKTSLPPATTPEAREKQMISLAVDLAERQLAEGTASSQVISHFLKMGSTRERLEQARLENENKLLVAKQEALESAKRVEELYTKALDAMRSYSGSHTQEVDEEYED